MKNIFPFQTTLLKGLLILTAINLTSCSQDGSSSWSFEKEDNNYQRAGRLFREEKYEEALSLFLKVIDRYKEAPESHLEAGRIYLEHIKDPIIAIYHFRKYLEYKPNVEQSPMVKQMIERSKKEFARSLPGQPFEPSPTTQGELASIIQELKDENRLLRKQLASIKKLNTSEIVSKIQPQEKKDTSKASPSNKEATAFDHHSTYKVAPGDTLSSISKKIYGTTSQWEKIYNLNKEKLTTPSSLKIGQMLKLPPKKD